MVTSTEPLAIAGRHGSVRWRSAGYWLATVLVAGELDSVASGTSPASHTSATR